MRPLGSVCPHGGPQTKPQKVAPINLLLADEYQRLANRTAAREPVLISPEESDLLNWITGLTGEAGEVADLVKKGIFHRQGVDRAKIKRELGDVLWYVAACCKTLDFSLAEVMEENVEKLRKRFPEGFSTERSTYREEIDVNTPIPTLKQYRARRPGFEHPQALRWRDIQPGQDILVKDEEDAKWYSAQVVGPHLTKVETMVVKDTDRRSSLYGETYDVDRYEITDARYYRKVAE